MSEENKTGNKFTLSSLLRKNKKAEPSISILIHGNNSLEERNNSYDLHKIKTDKARMRDLTESQDDSNIEIETLEKKKSNDDDLLGKKKNNPKFTKPKPVENRKNIVTVNGISSIFQLNSVKPVVKPIIESKPESGNFWNIDVKKDEEYARKKLMMPVDVKLDEEKQAAAITAEEDEKKIITNLKDQFCLFQLPTNLPLEGLYKESLPKDDNDFQLENNDDIFKILSEKRFDSTGFCLERDFKAPFVKETVIKEEKTKGPEKDINFDVYQLGKLCLMGDGSMKMRIGDNFFDVLPGMQDNFYKEIMAINSQKKMAHSLFQIQKKIIVKPDISSL